MSQTTASQTTDYVFNPETPEYISNPYPELTTLRNDHPVYFYEPAQAWLVSRYSDVEAALTDPRLSVNFYDWDLAPAPKPTEEQSDFERMMANMTYALGEVDHRRIRKLSNSAFAPRVIEKLKPEIQRVVDRCFDHIEATTGSDESFNFVDTIAEQVPVKSIACLVGVPDDRVEIFDSFAYGIMRGISPRVSEEERQEAQNVVPKGINLMWEIMAEKRANPSDDFLSELLTYEENGDKLTDWEIIALIGALIAAGSETTVSMLPRLVYHMLKHPEQLAQVRADQSLIQNAVSETLRFDSLGKLGVVRYTLEDVEIAGTTIPKGQLIHLMLGSAQRDPEAYDDADNFDIFRKKSSIIFGLGPHFCMGATIARATAEVVFKTLFERYPDVNLAGEREYTDNYSQRYIGKLMLNKR